MFEGGRLTHQLRACTPASARTADYSLRSAAPSSILRPPPVPYANAGHLLPAALPVLLAYVLSLRD